MSSIDEQREVFETYCTERYVGESGSQTSKTVTREKGQKIVKLLRNEPGTEAFGSKFKFWVKQRGFSLINYSPLGLKDVLCLPSKKQVSYSHSVNILSALLTGLLLQNPNDPTILAKWRRVAFVEDFFEILKEVHCKEKGHVGSKKTVEEVWTFFCFMVL